MKKLISERAQLIDASGIRKVFALAENLKDPINLSIGQPDYDVPQEIKEHAIEAIQEGFNKYSQTAGEKELIKKISVKVSRKNGWEEPSVMVTSGVSGGLLLSFLALVNEGDEVIIPDPYFVIYKHIVNLLGGRCIFIDTYPDFKIPVEKIEKAISNRTKLIIINSPNNPTGMVYSEGQLKALAQIAERRGIPVLSDEIYESFSYDGDCPSISRYYDKTILLGGFGKSFAMTGWRLGYAAVHKSMKEVMEQMIKIQQYTFVCAPTPFQKAVINTLDYDTSSFTAEYRKKRDIVYEGLKDKFELTKPTGAFYAFVKAPGGDGTKFAEKAISQNVLIIPGKVFSEKDTHFRISYATSNEKLSRGIKILCDILLQ